MRRNGNADGWTWIPAEEIRQRRRQAIGGLVLAVACLSLGIFIGRVSISRQEVLTAEQKPAPAPLPAPTASPQLARQASPEPAPRPEPERSTAQAARPTQPERSPTQAPSLALGSEAQGNSDAAKIAPPSADPPVLLNPGTAGSRRSDEGPVRWKRSLAKQRLARRPSRSADRRPAAGSSRDYQSLRDYVLNK